MTELSTLNLRAATSGLLVYTEVSALSIAGFVLLVNLAMLDKLREGEIGGLDIWVPLTFSTAL
jgi:hypothetical protein